MKFYFDRQVYFAFAVIFFIALLVFIYKRINQENLTPAFSIPKNAFLNETILLKDSTKGAEIWEWDFGDSTQSFDQNPEHIFESTGTFTVQLTVNNKYKAEKKIIISQKVLPIEENSEVAKKTDTLTGKGGKTKGGGGNPGNTKKDPIEIMVPINNNWSDTICPIKVSNDMRDDFGGPVKILGSVDIIVRNKRKIYASVSATFMNMDEKKSVKAVIDDERILLFEAPPDKIIQSVDASTEYFRFIQEPKNHNPLSKNFAGFVHRIEVIGDTKYKDLPCDGSTDKCRLTIYFDDFKVTLADGD